MTKRKAQTKKAATKFVSQKHVGKVAKPIKVPALEVVQISATLYLFKARASILFAALSINRRIEDKDEGYQRTLSLSRVQAIAQYIMAAQNPIPGAVIVCLDSATFDRKRGELELPAGTDIGWVIDGQHRLAGAHEAAMRGTDVDLPVVAFVGLSKEKQIQQFITINKEAKNVPTSLYLDLLRQLPPSMNPAEIAKERASDLGSQLRRDPHAPFYERLTVTISPKPGQLSLTNFVRKIAPLVTPEKGVLSQFTEVEQRKIISNYYKGLQQVFGEEFDRKDSMFFKTLGFGALWNAFPLFFNLAIKYQQGFEVKDVVALLKRSGGFNFDSWKQAGTGNQAEINAGEEIKAQLQLAFREGQVTGSIRV